jgi:hypothetical protein
MRAYVKILTLLDFSFIKHFRLFFSRGLNLVLNTLTLNLVKKKDVTSLTSLRINSQMNTTV